MTALFTCVVVKAIHDAPVTTQLERLGFDLACVPTSLDQPVGAALGAQAGFAKALIAEAGFGHVRKATETRFNMVIQTRL